MNVAPCIHIHRGYDSNDNTVTVTVTSLYVTSRGSPV